MATRASQTGSGSWPIATVVGLVLVGAACAAGPDRIEWTNPCAVTATVDLFVEGQLDAPTARYPVASGETLSVEISDEPFLVVIEELGFEERVLSSLLAGETHELAVDAHTCPSA